MFKITLSKHAAAIDSLLIHESNSSVFWREIRRPIERHIRDRELSNIAVFAELPIELILRIVRIWRLLNGGSTPEQSSVVKDHGEAIRLAVLTD
jgi:hypothetical protein